jgi:hypothetical protein
VTRQGTDRKPSSFPHPVTRGSLAKILCLSREKGPSSGICVCCKRLDSRHECSPPLLLFSAVFFLLFSLKRDEEEEEGPHACTARARDSALYTCVPRETALTP